MVLEKAPESPLGHMEIKPVNPRGNQSQIGRADAKMTLQYLWLPNVKNLLIGKDHDAGKD